MKTKMKARFKNGTKGNLFVRTISKARTLDIKVQINLITEVIT